MTECRIVRGISKPVVDAFESSSFFSESDLCLDGIVGMYIDGIYDEHELALRAYISEHQESYAAFSESTNGYRDLSGSLQYMELFIESNRLSEELDEYFKESRYRWRLNAQEARERLLNDKILPAISETRHSNVYIYRDSDHYAIHVIK